MALTWRTAPRMSKRLVARSLSLSPSAVHFFDLVLCRRGLDSNRNDRENKFNEEATFSISLSLSLSRKIQRDKTMENAAGAQLIDAEMCHSLQKVDHRYIIITMIGDRMPFLHLNSRNMEGFV